MKIKEAIAAEHARLKQLDQRQRQLSKLKMDIEHCLTLKCPGCKCMVGTSAEGPFFSGCAAITCGRCSVSFCGWCLEGCGSDAHGHVAHCAAKPTGADTFFPGEVSDVAGQFRQHWRRRTAQLVKEVLAAVNPVLSAEERRNALNDLSMQLEAIADLL